MKFLRALSAFYLTVSASLFDTIRISTNAKSMHHPNNSLRNLESTLASPVGKELHMTLVITFNIHTYRKNTTQSPCMSSCECSPNLSPP